LQQVEKITRLTNKHTPAYFAPEIETVFNELAKKESFWFELEFGSDAVETKEVRSVDRLLLSHEEIKQLALIFAEIIDRKSPFTRTHSQGIARMATKVAEAFGFSQHECLQVEIA